MDPEQEDFDPTYLLQKGVHKEKDSTQEENMQEGLKKSKQKKENVEDITHENENFHQEPNTQQDEENISEQNDINQEEKQINPDNADSENSGLEQEIYRPMEEDAMKQEDKVINIVQEINIEKEIITGEEEVINKDEEIVYQDQKISNTEEDNIKQEEEVINKHNMTVNQEEEVNILEEEIGNQEQEVNNMEEENTNKEEEIINQAEELNNTEEDILNQEGKVGNKDEETTNEQEEVNRNQEEEVNNTEEDIINQEGKVDNKDEETTNEQEEVNNNVEDNRNQENMVNNKEKVVFYHKEEINKEIEKVSNQENMVYNEEDSNNQEVSNKKEEILTQVNVEVDHENASLEQEMLQQIEHTNREEEAIKQECAPQKSEVEIMNQEEEVNNVKVEIINQEEEVNSKDEEIINQEEEVNNKEEKIINNEEENVNLEEKIKDEDEKEMAEPNINIEDESMGQEKEDITNNNEEIKFYEDNVNQETEKLNQEDIGQKENIINKPEEGRISHEEKEIDQEEEKVNYENTIIDDKKKDIHELPNDKEESIHQEEENTLQEEKSITHEEELPIDKKESIHQEEKNILQEENIIHEGELPKDKEESIQEVENILQEQKSITHEGELLNDKEESIHQEEENILQEEKSITHEEELSIDKEESTHQEEANIPQEEKNITHEGELPNDMKESIYQEEEKIIHEGELHNDMEESVHEEEESIPQEEKNTIHKGELPNDMEESVHEEEESIPQEGELPNDMEESVHEEEESISQEEKNIIHEGELPNDKEKSIYQEEENILQEEKSITHEEKLPIDKEESTLQEKENILNEEKNITHEGELPNDKEESIRQEEENILQEEKNTSHEKQLPSKKEDIMNGKNTGQKVLDMNQEKDTIISQLDNTNQEKENTIQDKNLQDEVDYIIEENENFHKDHTDQEGESTGIQNENGNKDSIPEVITLQENDVQDYEHINEEEGTDQEQNKSPEIETTNEEENCRQETENISKQSFSPADKDIFKEEQIIESKASELEGEFTDNMQDAAISMLESTSEDFVNDHQTKFANILQSLDLEDYFWGPKMKRFNDKLKELNLVSFITSKLSLMEVLKIGQEALKKNLPQRTEDVPWHFLHNLMSLNSTARNTRLDQSLDKKTNTMPDEEMDFMEDMDMSTSVHPLDVLCLLLNCSDSFLQQEIVTKMSMCQFALPLVLPAGQGLDITFMLWAMRDIVKRWRPQSLANVKGCMEDNLVNIPMPVFSFARLGRCNLSKSRILNYILSPVQQHYDFFVHQNMEGANIVREVSDGLVEISWCFPGGNEMLDLFPDPIAVTNLRGDLESNWGQFNFLTKVSSAVFIFIESMDDQCYSVLSNIEESNTNYFIILAPSSRCISVETQNHIKMLYPILKINRKNVLVKNNSINDAELVKKLQKIITDLIKSSPYYITLEEMSHIAADLGIRVDEGSEEHQNTRTLALEITKDVKDVVQYKNETMRLQGQYWKQLSKIEKEMCRMKGLGSDNAEDYRAKLVKKCYALRRHQSECSMPDGIFTFIAALTNLPRTEKHYFLKWMKLYLDSITRNHLSVLQAEYKEQYYRVNPNVERLKELDQIILNSSLGVEHFIREVGQFYEAEHFLAQDCTSDQKLYKIPSTAADLLLDGFPLELIDGDASNVPMQWITDVLTELDTKTGGECRMKVITVLGVQSTGKSTLLNTMFGLQFPVASGRCTRGAFMTLLKVKNNLTDELGCELILVIDTEGLKAPELASVEDSYEHDNELATFVVGLSDITIINMAMENTAEIKDILQIVVHAFLRMKELGKKPNCQFVHQNVSDVSAYDKNMRDRKKLLEQLDEMTKVASRMEEKSNMSKFSDVMDYDLERHSWYIPGLWHGVPPMASVNTGYSENIFELKKQIFETMKKQLESRKPQSISDFIKWIKSLWNAVKYEKFIFSFRNSLVAEAYNQLSIKYSELEWNFRKRMHKWIIEAENEILNQPASELETEMWGGIKEDMYQVLQEEEKVMLEALEEYFESGNKYVHLVERYREDFFRSATLLKNEVEDNLMVKCEEAIRIQKGKHEIQFVQNSYLRTIEEKATSLLDNCKNVKRQLSDEELKSEFEVMWNKTISGLQFSSLKKHNISQEMIDQLRKDMRHKAGYINEKLNEVKSLDDYGQNGLDVDKKYTQSSWYENMPDVNNAEYWDKVNGLVTSLKEQCNRHVTEQVNTMKDYDQTYCQELLNFVNERLNEEDVRSLHLTPLFELDLKLLLLGQAAPIFQKKHNIFFQENNMKSYLDKVKPQYFSAFKNVYQEKDESKVRAQKFCEVCLKPALSDYVYKNLGGEIVNDILTSGDSIRYSSRTFFQYTLLKELLEDHNFARYIKYNNHYETFVKNWIVKYITNRYKDFTSLESLKSKILACISRKIRQTLKDPRVRETPNVSQCLKTFCLLLKKDLVIMQNEMKVIAFQNNASPVQFLADIQEFLEVVEKEIITEIKHFTIEYVLNKTTLKPQDELFKKVFGCGQQCPFCKVPCEAGAANHKEHFASVHRPQGLGTYRYKDSKELSHSICTTDVVGNTTFLNSDTDWKPHPYKEYRKIYPDWTIQPDATIGASNYWKYIFKAFNKQFSDYFNARPAELPEDWHQITKEQALQNLKESFNMN